MRRILPFKARVRGTALEHSVNPETYDVGPGDIFLVSIVGLQNYILEATISPTGSLVLPNLGIIYTSGMTAAGVTKAVLDMISEVYPGFVGSCSLYGIREIRVSIAGAVSKPGLYQVTPLDRLTEVLRKADGWKATAALHRLRIERETGTINVDLQQYFYSGDMASNPVLREGDRIVVPYGDLENELISVRGLASKPAYFAIRTGQPLDVFLSRWYDPKSLADLGQVTIHRYNGGALQIQEPPAAQYASTALQPGDILYINTIAGIMVVGEVRRPGRYEYYPGYHAGDYIALAAGTTLEGASDKARITDANGKRKSARKPIELGDTIQVPQSLRSIMVGQSGMIQVALAVLNMYLAFLAASR